MLRPLLPENIEMRVQRADATGASRADAGAVEQILMNLVTNARDAMPNGGVLSIDVQRVFLDVDHRRTHGWGEPGEYVMISVTDTGVGMDADTRRRMFEPFFTTKALGAGTGLGMPMVFGLVKQHGGYIDVETMVGKGTSVRTYFPVAAAGESPVKRARSTATPRGTERILVAEDEEGVRRLARRSLEDLGYEVTVAVDGQEALEIIQGEPSRFQLIVSDVGMPRLSGLNLYRAVRAADIPTPFVLMSAYNADDLRADDHLPPAVAFLRKPWTLTDLGRRVRAVLDTAPARSVVRDRTVLVAHVDEATRNLVRDRLTETGALVTAVESADGALRHYRKAPADLVVTGLAMTGGGGGDLLRELRGEFPDVRILAIAGPANRQSGSAEDDTSLPLLHTPFSTAQLVDAAAAAMQGGTESADLERA
jgi:CheY-like chemotaxis protein